MARVEMKSFPSHIFMLLNSLIKSMESQLFNWFLMNLSKPFISLFFENSVKIPVFDKSKFIIIKFPLGILKIPRVLPPFIFLFIIHRNDIYTYINKIRFNLIRFGSSFLGFLLLGLLHDK